MSVGKRKRTWNNREKNMKRAAFLLAFLVLVDPTYAGKVKTWTAATSSHWEKATFQNAVVSSEGAIRLGRQLQPLDAGIDATRIWDVVEDHQGNLFVATGDEGKIYKITPNGKATVAFDSEDSQVFCLVAAPDGTIYAGTGPSGLIIRMDATGNASILHDSSENYIWALVFDRETQSLFAATGPHGRIDRVDCTTGKATTFFQSKQNHILCLVRSPTGTLFAGTDKQGLVYQIDAQAKSRVLMQAAQSEIRCLYWTEDALYAGTSSPSGAKSATSPSTNGAVPSGRLTSLAKPDSEEASSVRASSVGVSPPAAVDKRDGEKGVVAPNPTAPADGDNSVYRIGFDGSIREVFRDKGQVLSVLPAADRLFIGTAIKGQLFETSTVTRERNEVARLDCGQLQKLRQCRDGRIIVAAADPGKLFVLRDRFVEKGTITSDVIDAKLPSRWGTISWQATTPKGTSLSIAARSGQTSEPNDTWSSWSAEQSEPAGATAAVPPARYLQLRISLQSSEATISPELHHVSVRYSTLNQAPELSAIEMPAVDPAMAKEKKHRFKWTATDANEDELVFDLFIRKAGWTEWVKIESGWSKTDFEWDATTMPSGQYQLKVMASDRPDNPKAEALVAERISLPFVVANEAPRVRLKVAGIEKNRAILQAEASSEFARLASASFALDGGKWSKAFPADGLFDSAQESFRLETDMLEPGTHVVVLRVTDAAGNVGAADVVFSVKSAEK